MLTRRHIAIGGATLLAGTSMGPLAQAERVRPLKRLLEDLKEQSKLRTVELMQKQGKYYLLKALILHFHQQV